MALPGALCPISVLRCSLLLIRCATPWSFAHCSIRIVPCAMFHVGLLRSVAQGSSYKIHCPRFICPILQGPLPKIRLAKVHLPEVHFPKIHLLKLHLHSNTRFTRPPPVPNAQWPMPIGRCALSNIRCPMSIAKCSITSIRGQLPWPFSDCPTIDALLFSPG